MYKLVLTEVPVYSLPLYLPTSGESWDLLMAVSTFLFVHNVKNVEAGFHDVVLIIFWMELEVCSSVLLN